MKAKNILMSVLLAMGFIAAKAAGYPPELALVSQPVMVYNYNSITVYYDVQNIGDYTYRGDICLYLSPNNGYCYAEKYVKVCPGRIKRVAIDIPAYRPNPSYTYTIMPYYELGDELYSFTTFEYFEPLCFHWNGYHNEPWVVINVPPRPHYYTRPGSYRYYYDGFRPPMPPPPGMGFGPGTLPPPLNPLHHTYSYHHNNGGYPTHNNWNNTPPAPNGNVNPPAPNNGGGNNGNNGGASVRPKDNAGSMSHGNVNAGNNNGGNTPPPPPSNGSNSGASTSSSSGRTGNSGNVSRPNNNTNNGTVNSGSSSGRTGNGGNVSRPNNNTGSNSGTNNSNSGRTGNSGSNVRNGASTGSATSGTSSGSNTRSGNNSGRGSR